MDFWNFDDEQDDSHIDITPLIDVIFMLVIFFVLTTSFIRPAIDVELPLAEQGNSKNNNKEIQVIIPFEGEMLIDGQPGDADFLRAKLDADLESTLNIKADARVDFQKVVTIMEIAGEKRAGKFVISVGNSKEPQK